MYIETSWAGNHEVFWIILLSFSSLFLPDLFPWLAGPSHIIACKSKADNWYNISKYARASKTEEIETVTRQGGEKQRAHVNWQWPLCHVGDEIMLVASFHLLKFWLHLVQTQFCQLYEALPEPPKGFGLVLSPSLHPPHSCRVYRCCFSLGHISLSAKFSPLIIF